MAGFGSCRGPWVWVISSFSSNFILQDPGARHPAPVSMFSFGDRSQSKDRVMPILPGLPPPVPAWVVLCAWHPGTQEHPCLPLPHGWQYSTLGPRVSAG